MNNKVSEDMLLDNSNNLSNGSTHDNDSNTEQSWRYSSTGIWIVGVIRSILVTLNNLWVVPTYIVWCYIFLPLRYVAPDFYQRIERITFCWLDYFVAHWLHSADYRIYESGDDVSGLLAQRQCLIVSNHQSTADVPVVMSVLADGNKHPLGQRVCWIMDQMFRYTHFGIVSSFHGDFFIQQGRNTRQDQLTELKRHMDTVYKTRDRTCVILFPEGGFLYKRKETSQAYARKYGYPLLEHSTLPRVGALEVILHALSGNNTHSNGDTQETVTAARNRTDESKKMEWFIDMTIAYPRGCPLDIGHVFTGSRPPCNTIIHYRAYHISEVPLTEGSDALLNWVYQCWAEKDAMLDEYYTTGVFPSSKYRGTSLDDDDHVNNIYHMAAHKLSRRRQYHLPPTAQLLAGLRLHDRIAEWGQAKRACLHLISSRTVPAPAD